MNVRERVMAVLYHEEPDMIPWIPSSTLGRGALERDLRNMGMGIVCNVRTYKMEQPHVNVERKGEGDLLYTIYHTPVGDVSEKQRTNLTSLPWNIEYMIKDVKDYEVVKFMIEDAVYYPYYRDFPKADRDLGGDGIVMTGIQFSNPLLRALKMFMGHRRWAIDMYRNPKEFEELIEIIDKKQDELYRIVAESPVEVVLGGDAGVDDLILSPNLYEKYLLPCYDKYGRILHGKGKIYAVHMDGHLGHLKDLIERSNIDVIHGFTPPPMGNLPFDEARTAWGDRFVIWINFPETVFAYGVEETKRYAVQLIKAAAPDGNFIMGLTEDIPPNLVRKSLRAITKVIAGYGKYPLSQLR